MPSKLHMEKIIDERFREEILFFHRFFIIIFVLLGIFCFWSVIQLFSIPPLIFLFIVLSLPFLFGKMVITIDDGELIVTFGYIKALKKRISLSDIKYCQVVSYRPIRNFGGWGIRCGRYRGKIAACLSLKGNRGVLLTLLNQTRICLAKTNLLIIGSEEPEKLLEAIERKKSKLDL